MPSSGFTQCNTKRHRDPTPAKRVQPLCLFIVSIESTPAYLHASLCIQPGSGWCHEGRYAAPDIFYLISSLQADSQSLTYKTFAFPLLTHTGAPGHLNCVIKLLRDDTRWYLSRFFPNRYLSCIYLCDPRLAHAPKPCQWLAVCQVRERINAPSLLHGADVAQPCRLLSDHGLHPYKADDLNTRTSGLVCPWACPSPNFTEDSFMVWSLH